MSGISIDDFIKPKHKKVQDEKEKNFMIKKAFLKQTIKQLKKSGKNDALLNDYQIEFKGMR